MAGAVPGGTANSRTRAMGEEMGSGAATAFPSPPVTGGCTGSEPWPPWQAETKAAAAGSASVRRRSRRLIAPRTRRRRVMSRHLLPPRRTAGFRRPDAPRGSIASRTASGTPAGSRWPGGGRRNRGRRRGRRDPRARRRGATPPPGTGRRRRAPRRSRSTAATRGCCCRTRPHPSPGAHRGAGPPGCRGTPARGLA